jgi:hypothetical protein
MPFCFPHIQTERKDAGLDLSGRVAVIVGCDQRQVSGKAAPDYQRK